MRNNKSSKQKVVALSAVAVLVGFILGVNNILSNVKTELSVDAKEISSPSVPADNISAISTANVTVKKKKIHRLTLNSKRTLFIFGEVNDETEEVGRQITQLSKASQEPIVLLIDSPGGSVLSGEKVVSAMEASSASVYTVCVGMCASMAAIIHQYGTKRLATDRSVLMFHDASAVVGGRVSEMLSILNLIKRKLEKTNRYIAARAKMSYAEFITLGANNFWIDSEDAMEKNLVDELVFVEQ